MALAKRFATFVLALFMFLNGSLGPSSADTNPACVSSHAIANIIRKALPQLLQDKNGLIAGMQTKQMLEIPLETPMRADYSNFPASSGANFKQGEDLDEADTGMLVPPDFIYLPSWKIGALKFFEGGSGACVSWRPFSINGKGVQFTPYPDLFENPICSTDGADGYFGLINGSVVAILVEYNGRTDRGTPFRLQIQSWTGTNWDEDSIIEVK